MTILKNIGGIVGKIAVAPITVTADIITLGGACTEQNIPYTAQLCKGIMANVKNIMQAD